MADEEHDEPSDETVVERFRRERRAQIIGHIEQARQLETALDAHLVGVQGSLTGAGAKERAVFQHNVTGATLVIVGRNEDGSVATHEVDPTKFIWYWTLEEYLRTRLGDDGPSGLSR